MNAKKIYLRSFGCQMNDYDSARIIDLMREQGYERTAQPEDADLLVVVTCSIREKAQEKTFSDLGRLRELKKEKPSMRIAVGGCVASQEGKRILSRSPWVDVVFGPQTLHRLPELLAERERTGKPQVDIEFPEIEKFDCLPAPTATGATAFVSVMEVLFLLCGALYARRRNQSPFDGRPGGMCAFGQSRRQGDHAAGAKR